MANGKCHSLFGYFYIEIDIYREKEREREIDRKGQRKKERKGRGIKKKK